MEFRAVVHATLYSKIRSSPQCFVVHYLDTWIFFVACVCYCNFFSFSQNLLLLLLLLLFCLCSCFGRAMTRVEVYSYNKQTNTNKKKISGSCVKRNLCSWGFNLCCFFFCGCIMKRNWNRKNCKIIACSIHVVWNLRTCTWTIEILFGVERKVK